MKSTSYRVIAVALSVLFGAALAAALASAATTISTNIQTDGTLSVTGTSTLVGNLEIGTTTSQAPVTVQGNGTYNTDTVDFYEDSHLPDGVVSILGSDGVPIEAHSQYANGARFYTHSSADIYRAPSLILYRSLGAQGAPAAVQSGDILGYLQYGGYDGSTYFQSASIEAVAAQNFSGGAVGTNLDFYVDQNGVESLTSPIMRLAQSGNVGIEQSNPVSTLDVSGGVTVGSYSGAQAAPTNGMIISGKTGVGSSTPIANFQVANGSNAMTTMELGSSGQNKGSCLKLYRTDGTPIYAYVAAGATSFTLTTTACANVSNF